MKKRKMHSLVLSAVVATTAISSMAYLPIGNTAIAASTDRYINVSSSGSIQVQPDMAVLELGLSTNAKTSEKARTDNAKTLDKVIQAIKKAGVKSEDIQTQYVSVYPVYNYEKNTNEITGYAVSNQLTITVQDVSKAGDVVNAAMNAGANNLNGVSYDVKDRSKYYDQAVKKAMDSAKNKASAIAKVSGASLGSVLNVTDDTYDAGMSIGVSPVETAVDSKLSSEDIGNTLQPKTVNISANLNVTFSLK